jgi:predicted small lipoprotein YifL
MNARAVLPVLLVLPLIVVSLSACGRKGDLLTPSQAAAEERKAAAVEQGVKTEEPAAEEKPERRFILDSLIE